MAVWYVAIPRALAIAALAATFWLSVATLRLMIHGSGCGGASATQIPVAAPPAPSSNADQFAAAQTDGFRYPCGGEPRPTRRYRAFQVPVHVVPAFDPLRR